MIVKKGLFKGKKGFAYDILMILVVATLLTSIAVAQFVKQGRFGDTLGDMAVKSMNTYKEGEKTLFLIDQAAKYSGYKTVHELAEEGGVFRGSEGCGDFLDYKILFDRDKYCDSDLGEEFKEVFNKNIDTYLSGIPPVDSFILQLFNSDKIKIIGVSKNMLEFPISHIIEKPIEPIEKKLVCTIPELKEPPYEIITCQPLKFSHCKFKPEVLERLLEAQNIAKREGEKLIITSGFRTIEQQAKLREIYGSRAAKPRCGAPHIAGDAVDVALEGRAHMDDTRISYIGFKERKKLQKIMCEAGFVRWLGEFWHYEYGTSRWKKAKELEQKTGEKICALA